MWSSNPLPDLRRVYDESKAREILKSCGLTFHHTATDSRYISKRLGYGICELYEGHYGRGILVHRAETRKLGTHSIVEYWLEEGEEVGKEGQGTNSGCIRGTVQHGAVTRDPSEAGEEG